MAQRKERRIPARTSAVVSQPIASALGGPRRPRASAPRRKSPQSFTRFVPIWMKIAPTRAAIAGARRKRWSRAASADPTATGTKAAARVGMRTACSHACARFTEGFSVTASGKAAEFGEIRFPPLEVCVPPLLRLLGHVVEKRRVSGELLQPDLAVAFGVERGLEAPERERAHGEYLAAPGDGLLLESLERDHLIHQPHLARLAGVVLPAEVPDLARPFLPDDARKVRGPEPAVEGADLRPGLAKDRVIRRDRQVAHDVEHVSAADRITRDHRHNRFREGTDLLLKVEHVQARHLIVADVSSGTTHALIPPRAERFVSGAGQDCDADLRVLPHVLEGLNHLADGERAERVPHVGAVDGDLGNPFGLFVKDIGERAGGFPRDAYGLGHDRRLLFVRT